MAKRPQIRWEGELLKPIRWNGPRTKQILPYKAIPEPQSAQAQAKTASRYERALLEVFVEGHRKLARLKEYFAIPAGPTSDRLLALRLAMEFVPGFQLTAGLGRPRRKWTDGGCIGLIIDVENIKRTTGRESDRDRDALVA